MISIQDLTDAGYSRYEARHNGADALYQKCVWANDRGVKLYYINVYLWSFPGHNIRPQVTAEARFHMPDDLYMDVKVSPGESTTLKYIEDHFSKYYTVMGCIPDVHNN